MPVIIHWAANLLFGVACARAVRGAPALCAAGQAPWPLLFLAALQAVFITPCITYLFRYWPAWSMFYLFDPADYPSLEVFIGMLSALVVLTNFGLVWLGFACGRRSICAGRERWVQIPTMASAVLLGICLAYLGDRMAYAGDYETFWRGDAPLFVYTPAGWVGFAMLAVGAVFLSVLNSRYARRDPVFI